MIDFDSILEKSGLTLGQIALLESYARKRFFEEGVADDSFQNILLYAYDNGLISFEHEAINEMVKFAEMSVLMEEKALIEQKITQIDERLGQIQGNE